jgi:hypothetical protein
VATIFDVPEPDETELKLLGLANRHLASFDLPIAGNKAHKAEFLSLARSYFESPRYALNRVSQ